MKTPFQERLEKMSRRYHEVFGDLEAQAEFLKLTALALLVLLFLSLFGAFMLAKRPPLVIRVSEVGEAEPVRDLRTNNAPGEAELLFFARTFTRRYAEYNAYTLARDLSEAMNLMTGRYQAIAKRDLVESGLLAKVKEAGLNASIEFKEEKIERETADHAVVSLIGVRNLTSYKNPSYKESNLFKAQLVLKRFPRSLETPSGLLVEEYREIILNKLEGAQ